MYGIIRGRTKKREMKTLYWEYRLEGGTDVGPGLRRTRILVITLLVASLAFLHWPPIPPSPAALLTLPVSYFGPFNTQTNHGYQGRDRVSPVMPTSYPVLSLPREVGLQFIGDAPADLKSDKFTLCITGPGFHHRPHVANVIVHGFVGWKLPKRFSAGTYHLTFTLTGFNIPAQHWSLTVPSPSVPPARESSTNRRAIETLNTVRRTMGLGPVIWSPALTLAASAHARYLAKNGYRKPSFHMETRGNPGFTGHAPWNRDARFGWPTQVTGEVGIEDQNPAGGERMIHDLIDTVYHRLSLLSDNAWAAGEASQAGAHGAAVMDLGFGYRGHLPYAIVYPYPGQPGIPTAWVDIESPDPVPGGFDHIFGYPITVDFPTVEKLSDVRVRLYAGGQRVPVVEDLPSVHDMGDNQIGIVPKHPLTPQTLETVDIMAWGQFYDGTASHIAIHWSFGTGLARQSLAASVVSPESVRILDVNAGSGTAQAGQLITLYRRSPTNVLTRVQSGKTNQEGMWIVRRTTSTPGLYEAVSASKNAVVFWWGSHES